MSSDQTEDGDIEMEIEDSEENNGKGSEVMLDENLSIGAKIKALSREATSSQKMKIVRLVEEFQSVLDGKSNKEKESLTKDLMDKIYKELSSKTK